MRKIKKKLSLYSSILIVKLLEEIVTKVVVQDIIDSTENRYRTIVVDTTDRQNS